MAFAKKVGGGILWLWTKIISSTACLWTKLSRRNRATLLWSRRWLRTAKPTEWMSSFASLLTVLSAIAAGIVLVSNGFFLLRHRTLPKVMAADPHATLYLSIHHDDPVYREKLKPVFELLNGWIREHRIRAALYKSHTNWTRRYKGEGAAMEPYEDANPRQSWEKCPARYCMQLFEGKLWKCGPLAYLQLQDRRFGLAPKWAPYLNYQPLSPECTEAELREFTSRQEESSCGMCPARPEKFKLPIPIRSAARQAGQPAAQ